MGSCATISCVTNSATVWFFRIMVSLTAALTFAQALIAGSFLAGHFDMLAIHKNNSTIVVAAAALTIVAAVLLWRPGRGPGWPVWASLGFFACLALQTFLGYRRLVVFHIPLGTAIIALMLLLVVWAWRPVRRLAVAS
jgi:hypothetical protein